MPQSQSILKQRLRGIANVEYVSADGLAVLDVPLDRRRERTYEDPSIRSPQERAKAFWQQDHVRVYGRDFPARLEGAGFAVREGRFIAGLSEDMIQYHGLQRSPFHLCSKLRA